MTAIPRLDIHLKIVVKTFTFDLHLSTAEGLIIEYYPA